MNKMDICHCSRYKNFDVYIVCSGHYVRFIDVLLVGGFFGLLWYKLRHHVDSKVIPSSIFFGKSCLVLDTFDSLNAARRYVKDLFPGGG